MPTRFVYGHKDNFNGAGFILLEDERIKKYCQKYLGFNAEGTETRVYFDPIPTENLFVLVFTTKLPNGSSYERRGQIFVDGYVFSRQEISLYMDQPEKLLSFSYYKSPDDYREQKTVCLKEMVKQTNNRKKMSAVQKKAYLGCVMDNLNEMKTQILHIVDPFVPEEWQKSLVNALKVLPPEIRSEISFCINPKSVSEMNESEWNFISCHCYEKFEKTLFSGGKIVDRVILKGNEVLQIEGNAIADKTIYEGYFKNRKDIWNLFREIDGNRQMLKNTTEAMMKECIVKNDASDEIQEVHLEKEKKVCEVWKVLVMLGEFIALFLCGIFWASKFDVKMNEIPSYVTIQVEISVLVFFTQFMFACVAASLAGKLKKLIHQKRKKEK